MPALKRDIGRDGATVPSEVVNLTEAWPQRFSSAGFDLVEGVSSLGFQPILIEGQEVNTKGFEFFLTALPGEVKEVTIPDDLYTQFWMLRTPADQPTPKNCQAILRFANRYGPLRHGVQHFHRKSDMLPARGESIWDWIFEIECLHDAVDLWETCWPLTGDVRQKAESRVVQRKLDSLRAPFPDLPPPPKRGALPWRPNTHLSFPPTWVTTDPVEFAELTVLETIRRALGTGGTVPCRVPGCPCPKEAEDIAAFDITRGDVKRTAPGRINVVVVAGSLIKTLWLQVASYVAGNRTLKRCAAPDCKRGHLMDVTETERPGAWTMHPECRERFKKRKRRLSMEEGKK